MPICFRAIVAIVLALPALAQQPPAATGKQAAQGKQALDLSPDGATATITSDIFDFGVSIE